MKRVNRNLGRLPKTLLSIFFAGCITLPMTGCKSTLQVQGNFPSPLVNQLPLTMGVKYNPQFKEFNYVEKNEKRDDWEIGIGSAQMALFDTVLPAMFKQVIAINEIPPSSGDNIDLYFEPTLEEFQYNMPRETKINMYEVWIKYNMKVYDKHGQLIADWILTAYGKTPSAFMKSEESALNEALVVALRDAGAGLALRFAHVPEINSWLEQYK